jgi:hypothetical protein
MQKNAKEFVSSVVHPRNNPITSFQSKKLTAGILYKCILDLRIVTTTLSIRNGTGMGLFNLLNFCTTELNVAKNIGKRT